MSWDVYLRKDGKVVSIEPTNDLGTMSVFPASTDAIYSITWNYGEFYAKYMPSGFREFMDGRKAKDAIPTLEKAVSELGTERKGSYWDVRPGNAGYALSVLLSWAKQHPDATFEVS